MFRNLRNRLIAINLAVTTLVLVVAFSSVYIVARADVQSRQEAVIDYSYQSGTTQVIVRNLRKQIQVEQKHFLQSLLISLFVAGVCVEIAVAIISYVLAETAIRPIKEAYDAQKTFVANASHEMKTPIAAIMANLEVADIQDNPWIDNVTQEVEYMNTLNQELLALARAESSISAARKVESVNLKDYVEEIIAPFRAQARAKGINFEFKTQLKTAKVKLTKNEFRQVITILIDNAIKYCNKKVAISLTSKSFAIENDGAKIAEEDLPRIFDRFYQTNKSAEGVGLGLAIAKTVADREGWKLVAQSGKYTRFTLTF